MEFRVGAPAAKAIAVTQYDVTGLAIEVRDPDGKVIGDISWQAGDGTRTYQVPISMAGEHQVTVVHSGVQDGRSVQATETGSFNIQAMKITVISIIPGQIGTIGVDAGKPDLVVSALSVTAHTATSITYAYTIKNIGTAPANMDGPTSADADNLSVQAYLSADTIYGNAGDIPAGGTIVGTSPLGFLNPGQTISGTFTSTATVNPSATPYLVLKVDQDNLVDESDETNNTASALIVSNALPDLVVSSLAVTSWSLNSVTYAWTITNVGTAPANMDGPTSANSDNLSVQAYLSADTIYGNAGDIPAGGTIVGNSPLGMLNPGQSISGSFTASVPLLFPPAAPFLVLKVDPDNLVAESDETNNTAATQF